MIALSILYTQKTKDAPPNDQIIASATKILVKAIEGKK